MFQDYVERIENSRVYSAANKTPLQTASILSRRLGNKVLLKREDLQPVFSFKLRGATRFHGVFSPNSKLREHVVPQKPVEEQESPKPKAYSMTWA